MKRKLEKNIVVISDLHLGEDLRPQVTSVSYLRRLATLERELIAFLNHYAEHRIGERPWRLVVNGDMVDFMSILILPDGQRTGERASDDEAEDTQKFGLGHSESESLTKMERVLERHRDVFAALGRFVRDGNELVVVVGNHDVEFHFERVQRRFVESLVAHGADAAQIRFCPWFYYEEELVYVEHGHQYDEYCSFDYQLHPVGERGSLTLTLAHAGVRYFTNRVPAMDPYVAERWGFINYMQWAWAQGARGVARLVLFYALLIKKLLETWSRLTERTHEAERHARHRERLRELAVTYRMAVEKVEALDGLRRIPVIKRLPAIFIALFLDRFVLVLLSLVALGTIIGAARGPLRWGAAGAVVLCAVVLNFLLARARLLDSSQLLRRVPQAIWRIVRAPFIVFGHSHLPEEVPLEGGGVYFNTGTWLSPDPEGAHAHAFTHLIISGQGELDEPRAQLCEWRNGASTPYRL